MRVRIAASSGWESGLGGGKNSLFFGTADLLVKRYYVMVT